MEEDSGLPRWVQGPTRLLIREKQEGQLIVGDSMMEEIVMMRTGHEPRDAVGY